MSDMYGYAHKLRSLWYLKTDEYYSIAALVLQLTNNGAQIFYISKMEQKELIKQYSNIVIYLEQRDYQYDTNK